MATFTICRFYVIIKGQKNDPSPSLNLLLYLLAGHVVCVLVMVTMHILQSNSRKSWMGFQQLLQLSV